MEKNILETDSSSLANTEKFDDLKQFVVFIVGNETFAVDMIPVQEIIRLPGIVKVPLAPLSLEGIANLRGRVLPIVNLRRIFNFEEKTYDDSTRALVIDLDQFFGFIVDRVVSVINIGPEHIEGVEGIRGTIDSELLIGVIKDVAGFPLVMIIDFHKLISKEFANISTFSQSANSTFSVTEMEFNKNLEKEDDELQLVSFTVAGQEYAIDISRVQEIVQLPETIIHVPNSPPHVLGIMTLRDQLLPVVDLRCLFNLPNQVVDDRCRIVVIRLGTMVVGLITDSVSEVLRVDKKGINPVPHLFARQGEMSDISQICQLDNGKRLVSIISVDRMFNHASIKETLKTVEDMKENKELKETIETDNEEQVVVFRLGEGEFGVPIESVQEILRVPDELTRIPKAPNFVEGVINLRGVVLPVIDQRRQFELPSIERNDRQRIIVILLNDMRVGFIVDAVSEVLKIPKKDIEPSPKVFREQAKFLNRIANLEKQKRIIQLIEPTNLLDETNQLQLTNLV
jgi:purine-binding chemotaxis protein CheW